MLSTTNKRTTPTTSTKKPGTAVTKKAADGKAAPPTSETSDKQLVQLRSELDAEKEKRNYFQLERDKINTLWEICKTELEEKKAEMRNVQRELEEMEERHQVEVKVYKQKVKHLLYEHKNETAEMKIEREKALIELGDEFRKKEQETGRNHQALKLEVKEIELSHEDVIKNLKKDYDKQITALRQDHERQLVDLTKQYEHRISELLEELDMRKKNEIHELEESKNAHIKDLIDKHAKAFGDTKAYYNEITLNNLVLIKTLKEQLEESKRKEAATEKHMGEIAVENKQLREPLEAANKELADLRHQLRSYDKDKVTLKNAKTRLAQVETQLKELKWEHEVLEQRFAKVQSERDELYDRFSDAVFEVQQKNGFKNILLEKRLGSMSVALEKKEAQLAEVLAAANLDPTAVGQVTSRLDQLLSDKNTEIKELKYELAKVNKQHDEAMSLYRSKLQDAGIDLN